MSRSTLITAGCGALALALLLFVRGGPTPARSRPAAVVEHTPPSPPPPGPPRAPATSPAAPPFAAAAVAAPGEDEEPPPPTPDQLVPRPERNALTPEELGEQKLASLELIARSIERLEKERTEAARSGDAETARRNQTRIDRLRQRGSQIEQELAAGEPHYGEPGER